jgi:hypothetical protein
MGNARSFVPRPSGAAAPLLRCTGGPSSVMGWRHTEHSLASSVPRMVFWSIQSLCECSAVQFRRRKLATIISNPRCGLRLRQFAAPRRGDPTGFAAFRARSHFPEPTRRLLQNVRIQLIGHLWQTEQTEEVLETISACLKPHGLLVIETWIRKASAALCSLLVLGLATARRARYAGGEVRPHNVESADRFFQAGRLNFFTSEDKVSQAACDCFARYFRITRSV